MSRGVRGLSISPETCERHYRSRIIPTANQNVPFCAEWADKEVTPTRLQGFLLSRAVIANTDRCRLLAGVFQRREGRPWLHLSFQPQSQLAPMQHAAFSIFSHPRQTAGLLTLCSCFMFNSRCASSWGMGGGGWGWADLLSAY